MLATIDGTVTQDGQFVAWFRLALLRIQRVVQAAGSSRLLFDQLDKTLALFAPTTLRSQCLQALLIAHNPLTTAFGEQQLRGLSGPGR